MHVRRLGAPLLFLLLIAHGLLPGVSAAQPVNGYLVVMSAFEPELTRLLDQADIQSIQHLDGRRYHLGTLAGNEVLLILSGIGLGRAEETTRAVLDAFPVASIVFSGIAGGINPDLHIGDVTIPTRWTQHDIDSPVWYAVDDLMLEVAWSVADSVVLADCTAESVCLDHQPTVVPGGNGVSGRRFVSDAGLRRRIWETFEADVVDMETVAVARVAQEGQVSFLAFRSLSDLAAGGAGNEFDTYFQLAADNAATVVITFLEAWAESKAARVPVEGQGGGLPKAIRLDQNYPNPFRDQTTLAFTLPAVGFVKLEVYDVLGRKRATLATGFFRAGRYRVIWDGAGAPDGVYFYRLQAAGTAITRRMVQGR